MRRSILAITGLVIVAIWWIPVVEARTWVVDAGGDGDFVLVSEGCAAAQDGDTVAIRPGDYNEYSGIDQAIMIDSIAVTILGLGASPEDVQLCLRLRPEHCPRVLMENVTFHDEDTPVYSILNDEVILRRCHFVDNTDDVQSAAAYIHFASVPAVLPIIEDCLFLRNRVMNGHGGALWIECGIVRRCAFIENEATEGGAVYAGAGIVPGQTQFASCLFLRNVAENGAALELWGNSFLYECTFWENRTTWSSGATIEGGGWCEPFERCIIGRTVNGYGLGCWAPLVPKCFCFWQNERGAYAGDCGVGEQYGCFEADPLFCDAEGGDFSLRSDSPCLPGEHGGWPCDLIGAFGEGCGSVPTESTTWGQIKNQFLKKK